MTTPEKCDHGWDARLGCEGCVRRVRAQYKEFPLQASRRKGTQPGPLSVPWAVADKAWQAYHQKWHSDQSVERLAQRGGFGWCEMDDFFPGWREATDTWRLLAAENARLKEALALGEGQRGQGGAALTRLWHHVRPSTPEEGAAVSVLRAAFPALPVPEGDSFLLWDGEKAVRRCAGCLAGEKCHCADCGKASDGTTLCTACQERVVGPVLAGLTGRRNDDPV